jgi:hypothetical protein
VGCSECGPTRTAAFAGVVWASQGRLVHRLDAADGHELGSTAVLPTRRGTDVAAIAADAAGATAAWTSGRARLAPEIALRGPARAAAASLNGRILWIATAPRTLEALDARSGRRLGPTVGTAVAATALAPGPRGVRVASPGSLEPVEPSPAAACGGSRPARTPHGRRRVALGAAGWRPAAPRPRNRRPRGASGRRAGRRAPAARPLAEGAPGHLARAGDPQRPFRPGVLPLSVARGRRCGVPHTLGGGGWIVLWGKVG